MKRVVWAAVGALAGWLVWSKVQEEREDRALWAEVTDSLDAAPASSIPAQS
ncbi:MAG: hypothetical protein GX427_00940 [Actinomycetales bacterium]|nr:hypothetical protein [Actinomycetales bacterium]